MKTNTLSRKTLLASTCLALGMTQGTAAFAQDAETASASNVIIVTAQKRDQNLQDVPLAITAIGGEALEDRGINDVTSLDTSVPGLSIGKSGSDARPAIRGVRTEEVDLFNDPTIGFFVDGIYKPRTSQALAAFVDLERVEVLRGPQGTLFGRNTYGGSIALVTAKPDGDFGVEGTASYGNFNDLRLEGVVNAPIGPDTGVRVVGVYQKSDGYVNVLAPRVDGQDQARDFNDNDQVYVRGTFRHQSGPGELIATVSHWDQSGYGAGGFGYTVAGTLQDEDGNPDLGGTLNRENARGGSAPGPSDEGPYDVYRNVNNERDSKETTLTLQGSLDFGAVTLRSISGFSDFRGRRQNDEDFSEADGSVLVLDTKSESMSQEFQLLSNGDGPFQWVAGLYYFNESGVEDFLFGGTPGNFFFTFRQAVDTDSYAAFAQTDIALSEQLKITLGGRYTRDDKKFVYRSPLGNATAGVDEEQSFKKFTWKAGAEFSPTPDNLLYAQVSTGFRSGGANGGNNPPVPTYGIQEITAYEIGSKNTFGNGAGFANLSLFYNDMDDILSNTFVPNGPTVVVARSNAGTARAYGAELEFGYDFRNGFKIDGNIAYLNAKFEDFLTSFPRQYSTATGLTVLPGANGAPDQLDLSGNDIPLSPDITVSLGAQYDLDIGVGYITPAVRFFWSDSYFTNEFNYDGAVDGRAGGRQESYTKTDATLTFRTEDDRFMLQGYIRNIENEAVLNRSVIGSGSNAEGGSVFQNFGQPRTYGIKAGFKF